MKNDVISSIQMNQVEKFPIESVEAFGLAYFNHLNSVLKNIDMQMVTDMVDALLAARERGSKIYFIGNGGSASTAGHFANDLSVGTRQNEKPFKAISLSDNVSILTALGNDIGYEHVFSRQIELLGDADDVVVAISASGNSPNLVNGIEAAKRLKMQTVAFTSFDGGAISTSAEICVHVPAGKGEYGPAEDGHLILNHLICAFLMRSLR